MVLSSRKFDPGCSSWIPDPESGSWLFTHPGSRIQGSKRHRIPDPGSGPQHWNKILENFCFQIGTVKFQFGAIVAVLPRGKQLIRAKNRYNVDVLRNKNANNLTKVFREETKEQRMDKNLLMQQKCSSVSWQNEGMWRMQNVQIVQRNKDYEYKGHMLNAPLLIYQQ